MSDSQQVLIEDYIEDDQEDQDNIINHPIDKDLLPENVSIFSRKDGSWCYVIGTAHVSQISATHVKELIELVKPNSIVVELCRSRVGILSQQAEEQNEKNEESVWKQISTGVKNKSGSQTLHNLLGQAVKSMTKDLDIQSGTEFKIAVQEGLKIGCKILLGDRPIEITFKRTWARLSYYEKLKIFCMILYVLVIGPKVSAEEIEKIKNGDIMTEMIEEMAKKFPGTLETIVHERDLYLTSSLRECPGDVVVGVVGLGHLPGITNHWDEPIDRAKLLTIPPQGTSFLKQTLILGSIVTAIIGCSIALTIKYIF